MVNLNKKMDETTILLFMLVGIVGIAITRFQIEVPFFERATAIQYALIFVAASIIYLIFYVAEILPHKYSEGVLFLYLGIHVWVYGTTSESFLFLSPTMTKYLGTGILLLIGIGSIFITWRNRQKSATALNP